MVHHSKELEQQFALQTAAAMCTAARTAPKGHGKDTIHTLVLTGEDKERLAEKMEEVGKRMMGEKWPTWYGRGANNVRAANAVVLIGAELKTRGVPQLRDLRICELRRMYRLRRALRHHVHRPRRRRSLGGGDGVRKQMRQPHHVLCRQGSSRAGLRR